MFRIIFALFFVPLSAAPLISGYFGGGVRKDALSWTIGDNEVDIMSELKYQNLNIAQGVAGLRLSICSLLLEVDAAGGIIYDGRDRDSDYAASGRTYEYSRSRSDIDGYVVDVTALLGRPIFCLTPKVGVTWHRQFLVAKRGFQEKHYDWCMHDPFPWQGIHSTYTADWIMGLAALELSGCLSKWRGSAELQMGGGAYLGNPCWYLRYDIASRFQVAPAQITSLRLRLDRCLLGPLAIFAGFDGHYGWTHKGIDRGTTDTGERFCQYFENGRWWSLAINFGLSCLY